MTNPSEMAIVVGSISAVLFGGYAAKTTTSVIGRYVQSKLGKPSLVRQTSRANWKYRWKNLISPKKKDVFTDMVFPKHLTSRLSWISNAAMNTKKHNAPFRNMLFHGHPGTGKTLFAQSLATNTGMDYAMIAGGDVGPLGADAVTEVHKLFDWAEASPRGTVLFIDEAEAFLRKGRGGSGTENAYADESDMSENTRNVLSAFLQRTGSESRKVMIVLATNMPTVFDPAVADRIDEQIEFPKPGVDEREKMLKLFFNKFIDHPKGEKNMLGWEVKPDPILVEGFEEETGVFKRLAASTDGYSGRQLAKYVIAMQSVVYGGLSPVLTPALAESVLKWKTDFGESLPDPAKTAKEYAERKQAEKEEQERQAAEKAEQDKTNSEQ